MADNTEQAGSGLVSLAEIEEAARLLAPWRSARRSSRCRGCTETS